MRRKENLIRGDLGYREILGTSGEKRGIGGSKQNFSISKQKEADEEERIRKKLDESP